MLMSAAFCPTDEQRRTVDAMVSYGILQVDIARVIGIDPDTLRKHFREEIDTGASRANARVGQYLFEHATGLSAAVSVSHMRATPFSVLTLRAGSSGSLHLR
jgi:hypothetical protein